MKLIIDNVKYGIVPYGTDNGSRALSLTFKEVDGDFDYKEEETPEGEEKVVVPQEVTIARGLIQDTLEKCKEAGYEVEWSKVLLAQCHLYFVGEKIVAPEYRRIMYEYLKALDIAGLTIQKDLIQKRYSDPEDMKSAVMKGEVRPPFKGLVTTPTYYTGRDIFYEKFNIVVAKLDVSESPKFNQMAMVEITNHNFAILSADFTDLEKNKKSLEENYENIGAISVLPDRVFILNSADSEDVAKYAMEKGYRLNKPMNYEACLKF